MPQYCKVCKHTKRLDIETLILSEEMSKKRIGSLFGISETSVRNHAFRCMGLATNREVEEVKAKAVRHDASILQRTGRRREIIEKQMLDAVEEGDKKEVRESALTAHKFDESEAEWGFRLKEMEDRDESMRIEVVHVKVKDEDSPVSD